MAKPKNRQTVYSVVRTQKDDPQDGVYSCPVIIGIYFSLDRAEEVKGKSIQEMKDKGLSQFFYFEVLAASYYDE